MNCQCGAPIAPTSGRGRPRKRCPACAADRSQLGKEWREANPARVDEYNRARREGYHAKHSVSKARARLAYALKVRRRVAEAQYALERAVEQELALAEKA
jgi:hypothetical protein